MKCDTCMNSRPIISENGTHAICTLPSIDAVYCMIGKEDYYIPFPKKRTKHKDIGVVERILVIDND